MGNVIFKCSTINKNVIKKYNYELTKERVEYGIHCSLEGGRGVTKPERHHREFKMPMMGSESCFADVTLQH